MKKTGVMLVVLCVAAAIFIMPVFGATVPDYSPSVYASTYLGSNGSTAYTTYSVTSLQPYLFNYTENDAYYSGQTRTYYLSYNIKQDYVVTFTIQNTSSEGNILIPSAWIGLQFNIPSYTPPTSPTNSGQYHVTKGWEFSNFSGDAISLRTTGGDTATNRLALLLDSDFYNGGYILLPEGYKIHCSFVITAVYHVDYYDSNSQGITTFPVVTTNTINLFDCPCSSLVFDTYNIQTNSDRESHLPSYSLDNIENNTNAIHDQLVSVLTNQDTIISNQNLAYIQRTSTNNYLSSLDSNVQNITDAYTSNASNITETQSNITDTNDLTSELHDQELTYYQQNESALNNVGLSNFSFDNNQSSGLGAVVTDFTTLWNNIGPLQIIFTFTLSMSLATYLLRHRPITNAIKKNEKK